MSPQLGFSTCRATSAPAESSGALAFIKGPIDVLFQLLVCLHKLEQQLTLLKDRSLTATARRPEVAGWAPSCGRPAGHLLLGTVGQWPPATGQWWNEKGRRPQNRPKTQGADSQLPGWQPKEKVAQLPQKRGTLETAWVASVHKKGGAPKTPVYQGKGPKNPGVAAPLAAACCRGNCRRVMYGRGWASGVVAVSLQFLFSLLCGC